MSAVPTGIPPLIEQQLLVLDKQIRDTAFVRGAGRLVLGISIFLGCGLLLDACLGLNGTIRGILLAAWVLLAFGLLWRNVIRPMFAPVSLASLAALVEQQFPELRERLTSLVELRGSEGTELAPGTSKLMQDLLARQTIKAFNQLSLDQVTFQRGPLRTALCAAAAVVLLIAPFAWNRDGYGLLLGRFFVPWGNFSWGADLELVVVEGDQVVARGSDVPIHVSVNSRRRLKSVDPDKISPLRLNWRDVSNASDQRRFVWDAETSTFVTTLPHVQHSLTFDVATEGARTGIHRINVANPPVMTRFQMEIEPAAYTGLPARSLASVPAEIRMPELSHVLITVEFKEPVVEARLLWPVPSQEKLPPLSPLRRNTAIEESIPFKLSPDHRRGTAEVVARATGPIAIRATNSSGLQNAESSRTLFVTPDEPPEIRLAGSEKPVFVRPDDHFEQSIEVYDDYGLTAVELHVEPSTGPEQIETLSADLLRDRPLSHTLKIDLSRLNLSGGQIVTYRIRAVDNRPDPAPQETWTPPRTLMVNTSLPQLPDQELAAEKQQLEDELVMLRAELNDSKEAMTKLHQQVEKESLGREPQSEKSEQLDALQNEQDALLERLQKLGDRLAERQMTQELAALTDQIAEEDLEIAQERLEQAKNKPSRDQLEPIAQAIDRAGAADKKLQRLERHLNELNKLEQDLSELSRLAQRAERLADELEKLDQQQEESSLQSKKSLDKHPQAVAAEEQSKGVKSAEDADPTHPIAQEPRANSKPADKSEPTGADAVEPNPTAEVAAKPPASTSPTDLEKNENRGKGSNQTDAESLRKLKGEGDKLSKQMDELLKKHPELLDAAKRDQQDRLNQLAEQSKQLAEAQSRLSETLKREADNAPAIASRPENRPSEDLRSEDLKSQNLKSENPPSEDAKSEDPKSINSKNASPPKTEQPQQSKEPNADSTDTPDFPDKQQGSQIAQSPNPSDAASAAPTSARERGQTALKRQEQITREATQQALDLARETGADSPATKSAADFARKAEQARQQAQAGQLAQAAEAAREAEKASEETRQQLNPDGQSTSPRANQAGKLSRQQHEAASELQELAQSPEAVRGAQIEGQRQLTAATSKLTRKLDDAAQALKSAPLNASKDASQVAEAGEKARKATEQAGQAMRQSEQANSQQDPQQSAASAAEAAEKLQKAAGEVAPTPMRPPGATPAPKEVSTKVAEATRQVKAAQQKLEQCNCPNPQGSNGSKAGANSGNASPSAASAASPDSPMKQGTPGARESSNQGQSESLSTAERPSDSTQSSPGDQKAGQGQADGQSATGNKSATASARKPAESPSNGSATGESGQPFKASPSTDASGKSPAGGSQEPGQTGGQSVADNKTAPTADGEAASRSSKEPTAQGTSPTPQPGSGQSMSSSAPSKSDGSQEPGQEARPHGDPDSGPNSDAAEETGLAIAAEQFRQFAKLLKAANGSARDSRPKSRPQRGTPLARSIPREPSSSSKSGESGEMAQGTDSAPDLGHLEIELQQQARQNWGRLPGKLRTEILQGAGKKSHPEYTQRIKSYFDEITKSAK